MKQSIHKMSICPGMPWGNLDNDNTVIYREENVTSGQDEITFTSRTGLPRTGHGINGIEAACSIQSGLIHTARKFQYGKFTFTVELPTFVGAIAVIELRDVNKGLIPGIDIMHFTLNGNLLDSRSIRAGIYVNYKETRVRDAKRRLSFRPYTNSPRIIVLDWQKDHITITVDGNKIYHTADADIMINDPMNLVMGTKLSPDYKGEFGMFTIYDATYEPNEEA